MRVKSHQLPITMRMAMELTEDSPPVEASTVDWSWASSLTPIPPDEGPGLGNYHWGWGGEQGSNLLAGYGGPL